jgi:hypothetical protein
LDSALETSAHYNAHGRFEDARLSEELLFGFVFPFYFRVILTTEKLKETS